MIETLRFQLRSDADESAFLLADKRLQTEFANLQPGMLRRTTARSEGQEWLVITIWDEPGSADAGDPMRSEHAACRAFGSLIDLTTARSDRYFELD